MDAVRARCECSSMPADIPVGGRGWIACLAMIGTLASAVASGGDEPPPGPPVRSARPPAAAPIDINLETVPDGPLPWHRSLAPAMEEARRLKTPILVRVGAEWCGWCKRLDKQIEMDEVQEELADWTLVELDADDDVDEVRRLSVGPIPALRVLNSAGRTVRSHDGYLPAAKLILWLRGEDSGSDPAPENTADITDIPDLHSTTLPALAGLLSHRDPGVREAVVRKLAANKGLAGPEVAKVFVQGKLAARLAALDLLTGWQAPVKEMDPWQPETITAERLSALEEWAGAIAGAAEEEMPVDALTPDQLSEARAEIIKILAADQVEMEAIGARLARYGNRLLPTVREVRAQAATDLARERLDWLRYRLVATDRLMLRWPWGLGQLAATDSKVRHDAAIELLQAVGSGDEALLIELFEHPDPFVRENSLKALHHVGGQRAASELTKLLGDPEPNIRAAVLKQMADNPSPEMVPQIRQYIDQETDSDLVVHAVRLLRQIKSRAAVECLLKLFKHASWQVRAEAVEAVGEIVQNNEHISVAPPPEAIAAASASAGPSSEFTSTVGRGSSGAVGKTTDLDIDAALLDVLNDSDGFVISRAVNALKNKDLEAAAVPLAKAAEQHPELIDTISQAMLSTNNLRTKSMPIVRGWLKHPDENLRASSLRIVHLAGSLNETEDLVPALSDPSEKVRIAAAAQVLRMCLAERPFSLMGFEEGMEMGGPVPMYAPAPVPPEFNGPPPPTAPDFNPAPPPMPPDDDHAPAPVIDTAREGKPKPSSLIGKIIRAAGELVNSFEGSLVDMYVADAPVSMADMGAMQDEWLAEFRSGKGQLPWMPATRDPLKKMFQSESIKERVAAGQALIALGDDDVLPVLVELATQDRSQVLPVAATLRWQPWELRLQTFQTLRSLLTSSASLAQLCRELDDVGDKRIAEPMWDVLAGDQVDSSLALAIHSILLRTYGILPEIGVVMPVEQNPFGFDPDPLRTRVLESSGVWPRRVALAILGRFAKSAAAETASTLLADDQAPEALRVDALIVALKCAPADEAERIAASMLLVGKPIFARPSLTYLAMGKTNLQGFADHSTPSMFTPPEEEETWGRRGRPLPNDLKPDVIRKYLDSSDADAAASAGYLLALQGDPVGLDKLILHYRQTAEEAYGASPWYRPVYEAIAATDAAHHVPILEEIYQTLRGFESDELREFYWIIRTMHGPEILKLRKRIRDEMGMEKLNRDAPLKKTSPKNAPPGAI